MLMNKKEFYASPEAETFEMRFEGMVCTSPGGYIPGGPGLYGDGEINNNDDY